MNTSGRQAQQAFSLIEIMVAIALLAGLMLIGFLRAGTDQGRASSEGLSNLLVAEFQAARADALASGEPVALCFPGNGVPHSRSFYRLKGRSKARIVDVKNTSGDFGESLIAVTHWGSNVALSRTDSSFDIAYWLPDDFSDFAFIFTPDGSLITNQLPLQDGSYRILVCSSLRYSSDTPSGGGLSRVAPDYFRATKAAAPFTITVNPDGVVSSLSGAPGLDVATQTFAMTSSPASPPVRGPQTFSPPVLKSIDVAPISNDNVATVTRTGTLTVGILAEDHSGDNLYVEWLEEKVSGVAAEDGSFSPSGRQLLTWNPSEKEWSMDVTWAPPIDAEVGDVFKLSCTLSNSAGAEVIGTSAMLNDVIVIDDPQFLVSDNTGVYELHENGTQLKKLLSGPVHNVRASPDGAKMVYEMESGPRSAPAGFVANADGSNPVRISGDREGTWDSPVWNTFGTRLYHDTPDGGIHSIRPDGTGGGLVLPLPPGWEENSQGLALSADSRYIAYGANVLRVPGDWDTFARDIFIGELDESVSPAVVRDWSNVTRDFPAGWEVDPNDLFMEFHPQPDDPDRPVLIVRELNTNSMQILSIVDSGASGDTRFSATFQALNYSDGTPVTTLGLTFKPDGTEIMTILSGEVRRYLWEDSGGVPVLSGMESIASGNFDHGSWR